MSNNTQVIKRDDAIKQIDAVYKDLSTKLTGKVNESMFKKTSTISTSRRYLDDIY